MKSLLLFYAAIFTTLIGLSAAGSNKEPCKVDADCDATKFLHCTKLPFDTKQQCLCKPDTTWQGNPEECRLRDGAICDKDAEFGLDKPLCLDGFDCGSGTDDVSGQAITLCKRNPLGSKNVRKTRPSDFNTTKPNDPDAAQASKWKEEHPESVPDSTGNSESNVTTTKPAELNATSGMLMGRSFRRQGKAAEETSDAPANEAIADENTSAAAEYQPAGLEDSNAASGEGADATKQGGFQPPASGAGRKLSGAVPPQGSPGSDIGCGDTVCDPNDRHNKEKLERLYKTLYGSFAVNSKTLSSTVAIFAVIFGTMIVI